MDKQANYIQVINASLPSIQELRKCYPEHASTPELLPCKKLYMASKMATPLLMAREMGKTAENEKIKLSANFLNNCAVGLTVAGAFLPALAIYTRLPDLAKKG